MKLEPQLRHANSKLDALLLLATAVLLIGVVCIPVWPGFMSYDSLEALKSARNGVPDNVYPPMTAYVQYLFDWILPGGGLLFAFQVSLYLLSCAAILIYARVPIWLGVAGLTFLTLTPATFGPLLVVWKDILVMALLMCCTFLYQIVAGRSSVNKSSAAHFFTMLLLLFVASAYRHNSFTAVVPFVCSSIYSFFHRNFPKAILCGIAVFGVFGSAIFLLNSYRLPDMKPLSGCLISQSQIADLIGISTFSGKNLLPAQFTRKYANYTIDDLRNAYCPDHVNRSFIKAGANQTPPDREVSMDLMTKGLWQDGSGNHLDSKEIAHAWRQAVAQNFPAYLHHRWVFALEFLGIGKRTPNLLYYTEIAPNKFGLEFKPNRLTKYTLDYLQYSSTWIIAFPWFYYVLGLFISVLMCFVRPPNWNVPALLIVSAFSTFVPLVIFSASAEQRYHEWSMAALSMAAILYLNALIQKRETHSEPTT